MPRRETDNTPAPSAVRDLKLPMGALVGTMIVAMIIGTTGAKLLHDAAPIAAWAVALGLALMIQIGARRVSTRPAAGRPLGVLSALCMLAVGYLMMLGLMLIPPPPPASQGLFSLLTRLMALLTVLGLAAAVPFVLAFSGFVRNRAETRSTTARASGSDVSCASIRSSAEGSSAWSSHRSVVLPL